MQHTSRNAVTCLRCEAVHRRNNAFHKPINDNIANVVHIRFPCRCTLADFQGAVAAREKLGDLFASIRNQAVALRGHIPESVGQLFKAVHLQNVSMPLVMTGKQQFGSFGRGREKLI